MKKSVDFYFDCSSPWSYLAFVRVQPIAAERGAEVNWKPILVGGVFNEVNKDVYAQRDAMFTDTGRRAQYFRKDADDWAEHVGLKIGFPDFHPANSVKAMRGCLVAMQDGKMIPFADKVFQTYWSEERDIGQLEVLQPIAEELGIENFAERISEQSCKDALRANTDELIERGGFGSPTMFVNDRMFFGNDRLELVAGQLDKN